MPYIHLTTHIHAPAERCFDLSRDIDLHQQSMQRSNEKAVAGRTSGLIGLDETVTWKARHFGIAMLLTSKITEFKYPQYFVDEMISGPFKKLRHLHSFEQKNGFTLVTDRFYFESPLGFLGSLANALFLKRYLGKLLGERNCAIKKIAEQANS